MKLPYRWNDDTPYALPVGPKNLMVTSPYLIGVIDIRWDNPADYAANNGLDIIGVNVYRSYDSPEGPYTKLTDTPLGILYYRDQTSEVTVTDEDPMAGGRIIMGTNATGDWVVKTYHQPIVIPGSNGEIAESVQHVTVRIKETSTSSWVTVPAFKVVGETGEIFLIRSLTYNHTTNRLDPPVLPDPNRGGEIRVGYTYIDNKIETNIYRKVYYKVTTIADDPDSGDRIETPLADQEAGSLYDMEKIDWVWAEAIRRNRWILEQGGERVKVFIRKWFGERCTCWDEQYRTPKEDCHVCFPPGTLVNTALGWKKIEDIGPGDRVLSGDGTYQRVTASIERPYEGDLISIRSSVNTNDVRATVLHPFLAMRSSHEIKGTCGPKCDSYIKRGDGNARREDVHKLPSGNWQARVQIHGTRKKGRISLGTYATKKEAVEVIEAYKRENLPPTHQLKWEEAQNVVAGDWLVPQWSREAVKDINTVTVPIDMSTKKKRGSVMKGSNIFTVDEDFLWMIGMYLAEGSKGTRSIEFSLHAMEKSFQDRLLFFFNNYGYSPKLYVKGNRAGVVVNSQKLCRWFQEWLGSYAWEKRIPQEFMLLPEHKLRAILQGVYDGDGSKRDREIIQTSEVLTLQLVELLHRVGEQPLVRDYISRTPLESGNKRRPAYCVSWAEDSLKHKNRKGRWVFKNNLLANVRKVNRECYRGSVYNLEVEGEHTYVVNGLVVHNCYGTGYIGGYDGPFDIIVAPPETEKTIQLEIGGLRVHYDWATWTGPYPLISDRDFVVRQNNNRFTIAHVNPQGSRGAIYQQHFMLAPLPHKDIRYQMPITGGASGVPAPWNAYREDQPTDASPVIPEKPEIPDQYRYEGRTVTFENILY